MFGPHLTLDLYHCNGKKLSDFDFVFKLLDELPDFIGMKKFSPPHITNVPARSNSFDQGGLSGFVILVESHITIHTFPADCFASVDIFSCKEFDLNKATNYLVESLEAKKAEKNSFIRGKNFVKHYPKNIARSQKLVIKERGKIPQ